MHLPFKQWHLIFDFLNLSVSLSLNFRFILNIMLRKKRNYAVLSVIMLMIWTSGCHKDDDDSSSTSTTYKMKNANNGQTFLGGNTSIYLDNDNCFTGGQFVDLGRISGLDDILNIPDTDWRLTMPITPEYGYVARYGADYYGIYVVAYLTDASDASLITGAEVYYQKLCLLPVPSMQTSPPYATGSIYSVNGVRGIVYKVSADGAHGMIMSLYETTCAWATVNNEPGCSDEDSGMNNMNRVKGQSGWPNQYPAFKWCDALNTADDVSGWYLPAPHEMDELRAASLAYWDQMEETLHYYGGDMMVMDIYWSSYEYSSYSAWSYTLDTGHQTNSLKSRAYRVRAVRAF
jgi:hypothetical protein